MSHVLSSATERRLLRAEAARTLLQLHAADALGEPERWSWDVLDRLPTWCLFDKERRERLQRVAGALMMGPELRLWVDREHLRRAERLLGADVLQKVLCQADSLACLIQSSDDPVADDSAVPTPDEDDPSLDARLLAAGAAVLVGTLHESLPLGGLIESLGPRAGDLSEATARHVLHGAEQILVNAALAQGNPA